MIFAEKLSVDLDAKFVIDWRDLHSIRRVRARRDTRNKAKPQSEKAIRSVALHMCQRPLCKQARE
jgi:hypothetical protein